MLAVKQNYKSTVWNLQVKMTLICLTMCLSELVNIKANCDQNDFSSALSMIKQPQERAFKSHIYQDF